MFASTHIAVTLKKRSVSETVFCILNKVFNYYFIPYALKKSQCSSKHILQAYTIGLCILVTIKVFVAIENYNKINWNK